MASVQNHRQHFANTPQVSHPRSTFDRSSGVKTTFDPGYLIPLKVDEIIPGDTVEIKTNCFIRTLTNVVPYMDNLWLDFFAFFDPSRLVWNNFEKFMGMQVDPGDSTDYTIPQVGAGGGAGGLDNYFGIQMADDIGGMDVNALPFRMYYHIFNEWFRDEDLMDSLPVPKDNGPDMVPYDIQRTAKRHDYFTSARPWPQKGPDVLIPMAPSAPVVGNAPLSIRAAGDTNSPRNMYMVPGTDQVRFGGPAPSVNAPISVVSSETSGLQALTAQIGGTINQLREAEAIQILLERDSRGGTRYIEMLKSQYGVTNPDFRLQRPELIGQGTLQVTSTPVPQTNATQDDTSPQGNLAANSIASMKEGFNFNHSFTEHGYLFIFVRARADLNYQQGVQPMWTRKKRFDFYIPALANLGEQPILNQEIYAVPPLIDPNHNTGVFGYKAAWDEYRYGYNNITGKFQSQTPNNLDQWHLAQYFTSAPTLNKTFIEENPPINRILAVEAQHDAFFGDFWFNWKHTRVMPTYSIPGWSRNL